MPVTCPRVQGVRESQARYLRGHDLVELYLTRFNQLQIIISDTFGVVDIQSFIFMEYEHHG